MKMWFNSPLRYPGGKNRLARSVAFICEENGINEHYVEPYAGGASVALHLLFDGHIKKITINDLDRSIYAFWHSVLNHTQEFCELVERTEINVENWIIQKDIQIQKESVSLFKLGFSTFFLNRTNRSGILTGGILGGKSQNGNDRIDCRFNKTELIQRIERIGKHKDCITLYDLDALKLIHKIQKNPSRNTLFYFDPPYFMKGPLLYMNHYTKKDHEELAQAIGEIKNARWIVSYDDSQEIAKLYSKYQQTKYNIFHTAFHMKKGTEMLVFSNNLYVPEYIRWPKTRHSLHKMPTIAKCRA